MGRHMTFATTTCPGCGRRVIIDGDGYCMYCGGPVGADGSDELDAQLDSLLGLIVAGVGEPADEPWAEILAPASALLASGDVEGAASEFSKTLEGRGEDEAASLKDAMFAEVVRWVLNSVWSGVTYRGGVLTVAPLLEVDGDRETSPHRLLEMIFDSVMDPESLVSGYDNAICMIESTDVLMTEYLLVAPSLVEQEALVDRFLSNAELLESVADMPRDQTYAADSMLNAAERLQFAMRRGIERTDADVMEFICEHWREKGTEELGGGAAEILTRIYDESFDDSEGFWSAVDRDAAAYVDAYTSPNF